MLNYSVLMTVYEKDNPEYLKDSINSMLNQTVKTNDFVLVCDGKLTEKLNSIVEQYAKDYKGLFNIIMLPENVGLGKALQLGVLQCKNEYVARMDDDDISCSNRCEVELDYMEKNQDISIVSSYMNEFDVDFTCPIRVKKVPINHDEILSYSKRRNPFNHSAVIFRKSAIIKAGNYSDMRTNQDVDLWVRMLNKGFRGANIDLPLVNFRFDNGTYERRKNWNNVKLLISVWRRFYNNKYCSFYDYIVVAFTQIAVFLMPESFIKWAYNHLR